MLIEKSAYAYREQSHGRHSAQAKELPREAADGHYFSVKTLTLACKKVFLATGELRVPIDKEFYNAAGKLHLAFASVRDLFL